MSSYGLGRSDAPGTPRAPETDDHASRTPETLTAPHRVQLRRTKGWRMPENTIKCSRPGPYGNPFYVGAFKPAYLERCAAAGREPLHDEWGSTVESIDEAIALFVAITLPTLDLEPLRGKNCACWCSLDEHCHVDSILLAANRPALLRVPAWAAWWGDENLLPLDGLDVQ